MTAERTLPVQLPMNVPTEPINCTTTKGSGFIFESSELRAAVLFYFDVVTHDGM